MSSLGNRRTSVKSKLQNCNVAQADRLKFRNPKLDSRNNHRTSNEENYQNGELLVPSFPPVSMLGDCFEFGILKFPTAVSILSESEEIDHPPSPRFDAAGEHGHENEFLRVIRV